MNSTNQNETEFIRQHEVTWLVPTIVNCILILCDIWVIARLIYFGIKTGKWRAIQKRNMDKLDAGLIYSACVGCAVALLVRLVSSQLAFNVGYDNNSDSICEDIYDFSFACYALVLLFVYIFLWLRQRIFYANQMLNVSYSKIVRVFSASSIILMIVSGLSVTVLNTLPHTYPSSPMGCIYQPTDLAHDTLSVLAGVAVLVLGQLILVGLFIYPLRQNRSLIDWKNCCKCFRTPIENSSPAGSPKVGYPTLQTIQINEISHNNLSPRKVPSPVANAKRRQSTTSIRIVGILRRTIIITAINIVTDLLVTFLSFFVFEDGTTRRISILVYDINLFIGVMLIVGTLSGAKKIFKSPFKGVELSSISS